MLSPFMLLQLRLMTFNIYHYHSRRLVSSQWMSERHNYYFFSTLGTRFPREPKNWLSNTKVGTIVSPIIIIILQKITERSGDKVNTTL